MHKQVVFLIDTNVDRCYTDNTQTLSNSLCLSCLRILHSLSSNVEKRGLAKTTKLQHTPVKWSYKFFSSKTHVTKIESHRLLDFKLRHFEEFENEVQRRFETNTAGNVVGSNVKPGEALNKALMQLLADFHWENLEIASPIKGRRRKETSSTAKNLVVLFTKCPKTSTQLKLFSGKQVPDADVFLDTLLPGSLYHQFCQVSKLKLNWIDIESVKYFENCDVKSVQIIETAIAKAGGSILPLDAIVQHGNPFFFPVNELLTDGSEETEVVEITKPAASAVNSQVALLLPTTAVLSAWLLQKNQTCPKREAAGTNNEVTLKIGQVRMVVVLDKMMTAENAIKVERPTIDLIDQDQYHSSVMKDVWPSDGDFQAYGVLPNRGVFDLLTLEVSWICHGQPGMTGGHHKRSNDRSKEFGDLLQHLTVQNLLLLFLCEGTGRLVILQPLTVSTAVLSMLAQGSQLLVEKQLVSQELGVTPLDPCGNEKTAYDNLVKRLVNHVAVQQQPSSTQKACTLPTFNSGQLDRWQIPGPSQAMQGLLTKLNQRISDLDFLSPEEASALQQLQRAYKQENKPPGLRDTPTSGPLVGTKTTEEKDPLELPQRGKQSRVSLSRTEMILHKSAAVARENRAGKDSSALGEKTRKERIVPAAQCADFRSIEELDAYLTSTYERVSTGEITSIDSTVQMMVSVALHYLKQSGADNPEGACKELLSRCLVKTGKQLRDRYSSDDSLTSEQKIAEYCVQVVLALEMVSTLDVTDQQEGQEGVNDEIVGFLRTLSFVSEPGLLNKFMESSLLHNYIHTIPRTLANIYDELMQPLPVVLSDLLSPDNDRSIDEQSMDTSARADLFETGGPPSMRTRSQHGSVGPPSSQPPSNSDMGQLESSFSRKRGGKRLIHHPSLADFGSKRQIVVEKVAKTKTSRSGKKGKDSHKKPRDKVSKALFDKPRGGVKLERRQSVAVMQTHGRSLRKTPRKSPRKAWKSPRRSVSPRKPLVAETPRHKQISHMLSKGEGHQRRHSVAVETTVSVIEESPEKTCGKTLKDTPTKGKRAKALLRRSFYSAGPTQRTKNMTQYFQLADRIAGRQRRTSGQGDLNGSKSTKPAKLLSFDMSAEFKSPDKNSSFLMSQLAASPSPAKVTPRKLLSQTPSKLAESPSQHTRSKQPGATAVADLFKSPTSRSRVTSPACRLLQSPVSRRQSPRVLAAESDTKMGPCSPQTTPEKPDGEYVCGVVLAGLDSPSQNTRHRTAQTPTRKSVRAALFAKSPAMKRGESPFRVTASPRTLLSKFGSPCKQPLDEISSLRSPLKSRNTSVQSPLKKCSSPRKHHDAVVTEETKHTKTILRKASHTMNITAYLDNANMTASDTGSSQPGVQKTPSPKSKKISKTPDSFDKWHRRKPRSTQSSPAVHKIKETALSVLPSESNSQTFSERKLEPVVEDFNYKAVVGTTRNKRSLLQSPEKTFTGSPSKRLRTHLEPVRHSSLRHSSLHSIGGGSQGFDTVGSFNDLSQVSNITVDNLSITNDEVFASLTSEPDDINMEVDDTENVGKPRINKKRSLIPMQGISSPRSKAFNRLLSGDFQLSDSSDSERPESPIFGSRNNSVRTRNRSGASKLVSHNSDGFNLDRVAEDINDAGSSPKLVGRSPVGKKYSPNVSAKSLMHLIQSPLLKSPDSSEKETGKSASSRSRRSLKMYN